MANEVPYMKMHGSQFDLEHVYDVDNGHLGYRCAYINMPLVGHRLLQAGIRLADLLNEIYRY